MPKPRSKSAKNAKKNKKPATGTARQVAFQTLRSILAGSYADAALDRYLRQASHLSGQDRGLVTELVYGCTRQRRSLDAIIDRLAKKPAQEQAPELRAVLHLGLYQIGYLTQIPNGIAVHETVELAKLSGLKGLSGLVNGILRNYVRRLESSGQDGPWCFPLPEDPTDRLGTLHSYPNWIVQFWCDRLGAEAAEQLCQWFNRVPALDLRVNQSRSDRPTVLKAIQETGADAGMVETLPQGIRVRKLGKSEAAGRKVMELPGFKEGWWAVQDASAQLVSLLLDPQPDEIIVDACAAPGGKTCHVADLMGDRGCIIALDRALSRLKKLRQNVQRFQLDSIRSLAIDACDWQTYATVDENYPEEQKEIFPDGLPELCDRLLLDVPCSGLGTLHRRADARWRQTPDNIADIVKIQRQILDATAPWVKPGGVLVYATCTINPPENLELINAFLGDNPSWAIAPPPADSIPAQFAKPDGTIEVWPHQYDMDGFFMVKMAKSQNTAAL
ncbi:MAG: 16S rRNA (cytosine(967)-C(5))-methyltransferase [Cyanobacteria bacterium P01_D01_bin.73]